MGIFRRTEKIQRRSEIETMWASALRAAAGVARKAATCEREVLQAVTEELRRLKLRATLALLTPDGELEIQTKPISQSTEGMLRRLTGLEIEGFRFNPQEVDIYRKVITTGEAVFTTDQTETIRQILPKSLRPLLSRITHILGREQPAIVAPLILADYPMGTISFTANWLSADDIPMVTALADHISIALGQVRTQKKMQDSLERQRLRNQVAEALASALDLPVVLERVISLAAEVTDADAGAIGLLDPDQETVRFPYIMGLPDELRLRPSLRGHGVIWNLIEERKTILQHEYGEHPEAIPAWVEAGVHAFLGVPLIAGDEVIGGLGLFILDTDRQFGEEEVEVAQAIASMSAIAIKNARLYTDATQRAEESQALIRIARSISALVDHETVLQMIAEQAQELLDADGSRIHLVDPEKGVLRCLVALDPEAEAIMAIELEIGQGITGYVAEHGVPVLQNDPREDPHGVYVLGPLGHEPESLALAPLKVRQRTMGVMTVRRLGFNRPFTPSDLDLLTAFAAQAAVALENADLYSQIAAQAQRLEIEVADRTRELALSEAHYRALVETSLAGIVQIDTEGRFSYVNQAFASLLEISTEELIGKPVTTYEGFVPEIHELVFDRFHDRMQHKRPAREVHDIELVTTSGRHIPAIVASSLIVDETGEPQGVTGLVFDISERKALEAALRAERDRLDALLTNIGDAVMVTDRNGVIEYVNQSWERLNGYSAEEALGKTPSLIRSGHHSEDFYAEMWETITSGRTWRGEVLNARKDGTQYDAALTITPVLNESGKTINFVGVQHDISALKELDRIKSQFVSDVSHELRTPLTNIRLYLDLLGRSTEDPARVTRYLMTLSRESERLANLIDDLLSLSRLDAEAIPFQPTPVDINELLAGLVEDRHTLASKRGLDLTLEADSSLPPITGDERLITQVFTNLLTNAMNYTPDGGQIILRTGKKASAEGEWVVAEVVDTGLGIPPEEITMIFRRFFRGHASQVTAAAGTGLGLAICKEIIDRHNGRITVESDGVPGHGSRLLVWLPFPKEM
ncbi:MAG TPA: GAF domain-containing protein [Anaerolineae bacterium]|nr:GAF domain-containing protein [Anaerolineae bacterium]